MTRKQKILSVLLGTVLVLSVVAATYAYFTASVNRTGNTGIVEVTTTQLANLTMTSMKSAEGSPIYPGWVGYQGINVSATGSGSSYYDLSLEITGGSNVKGDVLVTICKVEDSNTALAAGDFTFTAATAQVDTSYSPVRYYMTNGSITLPSPCTNIVSAVTLASLGSSYQLTASGGKEIAAGKNDKYYISYTYENKGQNQVQGENFTVTPVISARGGVEVSTNPFQLTPGIYTVNFNDFVYIGQTISEGIDTFNNSSSVIDAWNEGTGNSEEEGFLARYKLPPIALKHVLDTSDNTVTQSYIEFVVTNDYETVYDSMTAGTYEVRGGVDETELSSANQTVYNRNKEFLNRAFGETLCSESEYDGVYTYFCSASAYITGDEPLLDAQVENNGSVTVGLTGDAPKCIIQGDGENFFGYCYS